MNYPLISEYIEAIKAAEDNFQELTNLRPVLDADGQPVMTSGNFAVVFKMEDRETGKFYALKCFTKEQEGRAEAYHQIADALKDVDSPYLVSLHYLDKELFVDTEQTAETEFPVLLMDWVEGKTLDKYLRENLEDKYALEMLAYRFSQLAQWLIPQSFAHGDLKPDNILVREDGTLVLVDYDGMYVPAMKGQMARELGSPDFRHPQRTENDFDEHIDDFPLISILLSLVVISKEPGLQTFVEADCRLLFSEKNYTDISNCQILKSISFQGNYYLDLLIGTLVVFIANKHLKLQDICKSFEFKIPTAEDILNDGEIELGVDLALQFISWGQTYKQFESEMVNTWGGEVRPYLTTDFHKAIAYNELRTTYSDEEFDDGICINQVQYSKDRKRLFGLCCHYKNELVIQEGTLVICDEAFSDIWHEIEGYSINKIIIPKSVIKIGRNPFHGYVSEITCKSPFFEVIDDILYDRRKKKRLIQCVNRCDSYCVNNQVINIPEGVEIIGERAFYSCDLDSITIPRSVSRIEKNPFVVVNMSRKKPLEIICLSQHFKVIDHALYDCRNKTLISYFGKDKHMIVQEGTKVIGSEAFGGCTTLESISLPNSIENIGDYCFAWTESLKKIYVPSMSFDFFKRILHNEYEVGILVKKEENEEDQQSNNLNDNSVYDPFLSLQKINKCIEQQIDLNDIASAEGISFDNLLNLLELIVVTGERIDIGYFLQEVMDRNHIDVIYNYFKTSGNYSVTKAMEELGDDYSEDEIRLVRIKLQSDKPLNSEVAKSKTEKAVNNDDLPF